MPTCFCERNGFFQFVDGPCSVLTVAFVEVGEDAECYRQHDGAVRCVRNPSAAQR